VVERRLTVLERGLDGGREPAHVLAVERRERRDRAGVARRVAVAGLEPGRADDHLVDELRQRALGRAGDEPLGAAESPCGVERHVRRPLVADEDEQVGLGQRLERLHGAAARHRGVEGRPAAGEDGAPLGQPPAGRDAAQPLGLGEHRLACAAAG